MASWWVGKDRESFNVALKDHTQRVMRRDPPAVSTPEPLPQALPAPVPETPSVETAPEPRSNRWNKEWIAQGLCARCATPRTDNANLCTRCQGKFVARKQRQEGWQAWRPGVRGRAPKAMESRLQLATEIREAIVASDEATDSPALGRAAVVMFVGFLFGQRLDWITGWTGFSAAECKRVIGRLRRFGIWHPDRTIKAPWLDIVFGAPRYRNRLSKNDTFRFDVAFWLDAMVANGELTRTEDLRYGLSEWESGDEPSTR